MMGKSKINFFDERINSTLTLNMAQVTHSCVYTRNWETIAIAIPIPIESSKIQNVNKKNKNQQQKVRFLLLSIAY